MSVRKPATIKEIARQLGVSVSTVSRALHDHPAIGLRTKTRVRQLAAEMDYEPNQAAILFKQRKTFNIGVVLPNLREWFFAEATDGIEVVANRNKYNVLITTSKDDPEREKRILQTMKNNRVDGVIASLGKYTDTYDHFTALDKYNIPVVFFDRVPHLPDFHKVFSNMNSATREAIEFIIQEGHRDIAVINGPPEMKSSRERTEAYNQVLTKNGVTPDPNLIVSTDLTREGTFNAMKQLLEQEPRPTVVLVINDYIGLDAMYYAREHNLRINKDISFVSYSNLPGVRYLDNPPIASIDQFPFEQGSKAAEILMSLINRQPGMRTPDAFENIVINGQLIIRTRIAAT